MIGRRTIAGLARSLVPTEATIVMAVLAAGAAAAIAVGAEVIAATGSPWSARVSSIAATLAAMPVWVLIAGSMSQFAVRIAEARRDVTAWWRTRTAAAARDNLIKAAVAADMMHPDWPGPRTTEAFHAERDRRRQQQEAAP